jgi:REP element-mobilizing transposase RayT
MQYRRHLPHWFPPGASIFLTWRLHGSIPVRVLMRLREKARQPNARAFKMLDEELDQGGGPRWLANPQIADSVRDRLIRHAEVLSHYQLHAYAIMSNHVHMLITPTIPVARLMDALKTRTARRANEILGRTGLKFWHNESFDRWCRDEREFHLVRRYIENNPVKAGLGKSSEEWPWSSASKIACRAGCLATSAIPADLEIDDGFDSGKI